MKKKLLKLSIFSTLLLLVFITVFVVINLFDAPEPTGMFTLKDLTPASLDNSNGYFQLMSFSYPADKDIDSDDVIDNIRKFSKPEVLNLPSAEIEKLEKTHHELSQKRLLMKINKGEETLFKLIDQNDFDKVITQKEDINTVMNSNPLLLKRYLQLILKEKVEDFSLPSITYPIPRYHPVFKITKLYLAQNIIDAVEGRWEESVLNIFKQINFFRRLSENSRIVINKMVGLGMIRTSLKSLSFIMKQKDCPKAVYQSILNNLPPFREPEISLKKTIIFEFLSGVHIIDMAKESKESLFGEAHTLSSFFPSTGDWLNFLSKFKIFLNRNRTIQFYLDEVNKVLVFEKDPPFAWKADIMSLIPPDPKDGFFWWISNPVGKALHSIAYSSYQRTVYDKYKTQALLDLTRLSAEYYLKATPDKGVSEILNGLDSYKVIDPFSGKPYLFNEDKNIFYSVGINRIDDGGLDKKNKGNKYQELDFVLPCHFKRDTVENE